jgi:hypothetical protein
MNLRVAAGNRFERDLEELLTNGRNELRRVLAGLRKRPSSPGLGYGMNSLRGTHRIGVRVPHFLRD